VEAGANSGHALDKNIRFGRSYEYRAQRVAHVTVDGKTLELDGEISAPVRIAALDQFPPAVPTDLAAVATVGENGAETAIDLSWQPVTDADLVGYIVYRREAGRGGEAAWQRISPAGPLLPPAFHDNQVEPGHTYRYAVSALSQNGHESARSAEAEETVPTP
jgi:fibronectin type 3 domain-containing protein